MPSRPPRARAKPSEPSRPLTSKEMAAKLTAAGADPAKFTLGHTPAMAAAIAGISRPAIMKAVMRGTLTAHRWKAPDAKRGWIVITDESLRAYIARNRRP